MGRKEKSEKYGKNEPNRENSENSESYVKRAKKDWHLYCPPHVDLKIKEGDTIPDLPTKFLDALRTEGVI